MLRLPLPCLIQPFGIPALWAIALSIFIIDSIASAQIGVPGTPGGTGTPSNGGTPTYGDGTSTTLCPIRLLGRVEDVDGAGNLVCRYKIFVASNCVSDEYRVDLPCNVNKSDCKDGMCATPDTSNLIPVAPPDPNAVPTQPGSPPMPNPNPVPITDPNTIPGYRNAYASSSLSTGIPAVAPGSTRTIVPVEPNTNITEKFASLDQAGVIKHFRLIRIEKTEADGTKTTLGSGFQIPAIPAGRTTVPAVFRSMQNKTYQVEEYSSTGNIEWSYIVHESM